MRIMKAKPQALLDIRRLHGLSQAEAARRAGVAPSHLCRLEAGDLAGTVDVLKRIAAAYSVDVVTITDPTDEFRPSRRRKVVAA